MRRMDMLLPGLLLGLLLGACGGGGRSHPGADCPGHL